MTQLWIDDAVHPDPENATVPLLADAVLRGINVFEGIQAYRLVDAEYSVVSLTAHLNRFEQSAAAMALPYDNLKSVTLRAIKALLASESEKQLYVRPTLLLEQGYNGGPDRTRLFVTSRPSVATRCRPLTASISAYRHIAPNAYPYRAKIGAAYAFYRLARLEAIGAGADEAILLTAEGMVAETPGAAIFILRAGIVRTPPIECGILPSITRETVITILHSMAVRVTEAPLSPDDLLSADEVFIAGTLDEVRPIAFIDGTRVGTGAVDLSTAVHAVYVQACRGESPLALGGRTVIPGRLVE